MMMMTKLNILKLILIIIRVIKWCILAHDHDVDETIKIIVILMILVIQIVITVDVFN